MFEILKQRTFSASHQLRNYQGKCERMHGHNWKICVCVAGSSLDKAGMLLDFHDLDNVLKKSIEPFDHRHLNEVEPFDKLNPSSENIAKIIYEKIEIYMAKMNGLKIVYCDVWENETSRARYRK